MELLQSCTKLSTWPVSIGLNEIILWVEYVSPLQTELSSLPNALNWSPPSAAYIYASMNWVNIGSGNGLWSIQRQAITQANAGLLSIGLLGTYFSEIWFTFLSFSFKKMQLKMLSAKMAAIVSRVRWVAPHSYIVVHCGIWDRCIVGFVQLDYCYCLYVNGTGYIDDKSTLVQVMVWYCQATSYYLNQYWWSSIFDHYRNFHYGDKMGLWSSYCYNPNSSTDKTSM